MSHQNCRPCDPISSNSVLSYPLLPREEEPEEQEECVTPLFFLVFFLTSTAAELDFHVFVLRKIFAFPFISPEAIFLRINVI